jgi:hypothetical protein
MGAYDAGTAAAICGLSGNGGGAGTRTISRLTRSISASSRVWYRAAPMQRGGASRTHMIGGEA